MRRRRFNDEPITELLREQKAGTKTTESCRNHGVCDAIFHGQQACYGGLGVPEARRLKTPDDENLGLERPLAEPMLDNETRQPGPMCGPGCE